MTEELLSLLFEKRNERIRAMVQQDKPQEEFQPKQISADEWFQQMNSYKQTGTPVGVA